MSEELLSCRTFTLCFVDFTRACKSRNLLFVTETNVPGRNTVQWASKSLRLPRRNECFCENLTVVRVFQAPNIYRKKTAVYYKENKLQFHTSKSVELIHVMSIQISQRFEVYFCWKYLLINI